MTPFRSLVQERVRQQPLETLDAWTGSFRPIPELRAADDIYISPLRTLLWSYQPTGADIDALWALHRRDVLNQFPPRPLMPPAAMLLRAHPVLLARIVWRAMSRSIEVSEKKVPIVPTSNPFLKQRDPQKVAALKSQYTQILQLALHYLQTHFGFGSSKSPALIDSLRLEALSQLRSWTDVVPMDDHFFEKCIVGPAEALFLGQPLESPQLQVAVARSPACCAFLACHFLIKYGYNEVEQLG